MKAKILPLSIMKQDVCGDGISPDTNLIFVLHVETWKLRISSSTLNVHGFNMYTWKATTERGNRDRDSHMDAEA